MSADLTFQRLAVASYLKKAAADVESGLKTELLDVMEPGDRKRAAIEGQQIATISRAEIKEAETVTVTDEAALIAWAKKSLQMAIHHLTIAILIASKLDNKSKMRAWLFILDVERRLIQQQAQRCEIELDTRWAIKTTKSSFASKYTDLDFRYGPRGISVKEADLEWILRGVASRDRGSWRIQDESYGLF